MKNPIACNFMLPTDTVTIVFCFLGIVGALYILRVRTKYFKQESSFGMLISVTAYFDLLAAVTFLIGMVFEELEYYENCQTGFYDNWQSTKYTEQGWWAVHRIRRIFLLLNDIFYYGSANFGVFIAIAAFAIIYQRKSFQQFKWKFASIICVAIPLTVTTAFLIYYNIIFYEDSQFKTWNLVYEWSQIIQSSIAFAIMFGLFGITLVKLKRQVQEASHPQSSLLLMLNMVQALTFANLLQLFSSVLENYSIMYVTYPRPFAWTIVTYYYCVAVGSKGFLHAIALLFFEYSFVEGKFQSNITPTFKELDPTLLTIDWKDSIEESV
ncbi:hypothetical protein HK103_005450 [Boothiomyces macroporosus]|uniref:Uncharacterized protein n=1 Tax=Boothiomyces macroporosus TaxID=261099 RepID=A0AAD5ULV8_9FUNG|nr:hypothetical protein HK103_005450 [Boothiomyces macroporosus]